MSVRVQIDRLVLEGFRLSAAESRQVKAAMGSELSRLLTERGLSEDLQAGGATPAMRAGNFAPRRETQPSQLGRDIARSVHGGIGKAE